MHNVDTARVRWVQENLEITHNKLRPEDVQSWNYLYIDDIDKFFSLAILGYMNKNHFYGDSKTGLPDAEIKEFVAEFCEKIRRVSNGKRPKVGLSLFAIVGREKMNAIPERCQVISMSVAK